MTDHLSEVTLWRNEEILEYLKVSRLFNHLPDHILSRLVPLSEMASYPVGSKILEEGQVNNQVFFLLDGTVGVYAGTEFILRLQRKGDIFGEMSVITNKPCVASVVAETQVELFSIQANEIGKYTEFDSENLQNTVYRLFAMILSEKLVMTTEKAKQFETINRILKQDIEDRTKLVDALRIAKTEAEMANQAQRQFLANMSHEIRTPLNSIVGFGQILLQQAKQLSLPQEFVSYLENIEISGINLSELINNVLDLSRIQAGKLRLSVENLNLRLLIQSVFQVNKAQAIPKGLRFNYTIDAGVPEMICSDRTKLNQILMNLASNAIKFTPANKNVLIKVLREDDWLVFQVIDEGIGITKQKQKSIFDPFEQADSSTTRRYGGTGLGLAIVKEMTDLLEGQIELDSEQGKGSTFTVKVPLVEATEERVELQWEDYNFVRDNQVLLIEDNPMNQNMIRALFREFGIEIETANNGQEGIEKIQAAQTKGNLPDLVLMDMHMPEMDGLEATRQIRNLPEIQSIPIVALSADAFIEQQEVAYDAGVSGYLTKPLQIEKLLPILHKYLRYDKKTANVNIPTKKPSLPLTDALNQQILEEFKILVAIPHFKTSHISDQLQRIEKLCRGYDTPYPKSLKEIEDAVFSKRAEHAKNLIQKILKDAETSSRH